MKATEIRQRFLQEGLKSEDLNVNPVQQFEAWYEQAGKTDIHEPGAMSLATVDVDGQPWQRIVLLKMYDEEGFVFFTNYESRKAKQITENASVSLLFPWHSLGRQVLIVGEAEKVSSAESLSYFVTRPRGSQLGAWASGQSQMISSRSMLETMVDKMKQKYENQEVPLPPFWGGYRVRPNTFEFWQEQKSRLHDRFIYQQDVSKGWSVDRLSP